MEALRLHRVANSRINQMDGDCSYKSGDENGVVEKPQAKARAEEEPGESPSAYCGVS